MRKLLEELRVGFRISKSSFSSPEAALLLVSTNNRDLKICRHFVAACFYGNGLNGAIHSHARARGLSMRTHLTAVEPEVAILGADQTERGLWGRECKKLSLKFSSSSMVNCLRLVFTSDGVGVIRELMTYCSENRKSES